MKVSFSQGAQRISCRCLKKLEQALASKPLHPRCFESQSQLLGQSGEDVARVEETARLLPSRGGSGCPGLRLSGLLRSFLGSVVSGPIMTRTGFGVHATIVAWDKASISY